MELLREVDSVHIIGVDNMNDYYDVSIKEYRLQQIEKLAAQHPESSWNFIRGSIADKALIDQIFEEHKPAVVVNLAAQAGVRYSITNPDVYIESNMIGFYNILEACRHSYDDGQVLSIWFMHPVLLFMDQTRRFRILQRTKWTIRYLCMQRPRSQMN